MKVCVGYRAATNDRVHCGLISVISHSLMANNKLPKWCPINLLYLLPDEQPIKESYLYTEFVGKV